MFDNMVAPFAFLFALIALNMTTRLLARLGRFGDGVSRMLEIGLFVYCVLWFPGSYRVEYSVPLADAQVMAQARLPVIGTSATGTYRIDGVRLAPDGADGRLAVSLTGSVATATHVVPFSVAGTAVPQVNSLNGDAFRNDRTGDQGNVGLADFRIDRLTLADAVPLPSATPADAERAAAAIRAEAPRKLDKMIGSIPLYRVLDLQERAPLARFLPLLTIPAPFGATSVLDIFSSEHETAALVGNEIRFTVFPFGAFFLFALIVLVFVSVVAIFAFVQERFFSSPSADTSGSTPTAT